MAAETFGWIISLSAIGIALVAAAVSAFREVREKHNEENTEQYQLDSTEFET